MLKISYYSALSDFYLSAQASNIKIKHINGDVFLLGQKISKSNTFRYGDTIKTGEKSLIILKLENYSTIKLNEKKLLETR